MEFTFEMIETVTVKVTYVVEADSEATAMEMALIGATVDEKDHVAMEVIDRNFAPEPAAAAASVILYTELDTEVP